MTDTTYSKRKEILLNTFLNRMEFSDKYMTAEEYQTLADTFVDLSSASLHKYIRKEWIPGLDRNVMICLADYKNSPRKESSELHNIECIYEVFSVNPVTGIIEVSVTRPIKIADIEHRLDAEIVQSAKMGIPYTEACERIYANGMSLSPFSKKYALFPKELTSTIGAQIVKGTLDKINKRYNIYALREREKLQAELASRDDVTTKEILFELRKNDQMLRYDPGTKYHVLVNKMRMPGVARSYKKQWSRFFKENTDPSIRKLMGKTLSFDMHHYNILAGLTFHDGMENDGMYHASKQKSLYRCQAAVRFPLFFKSVLLEPKILKKIDKGIAPDKVLSEWTEIDMPINAIRKIEGVSWQKASAEMLYSEHYLKSACQVLKYLPVDFSPKTKKGWGALKEISKLQGKTGIFSYPEHAEMIRKSFGRNAKIKNIDELGKLMSGADNGFYSISGYEDFYNDFAKRVVLPQVLKIYQNMRTQGDFLSKADNDREIRDIAELFGPIDDTVKPIVAYFLKPNTVFGLMKESESWHDRTSELNRILEYGHVQGSSKWDSFLNEVFDAKNGLQIVCLHDVLSLIDEGNKMRHCVGTYATKCISQGSAILSIRDKEGNSLSTVEIAPKYIKKKSDSDDPKTYAIDMEIVQHRGTYNSQPSVESTEAMAELVEKIHNKELEINWSALDVRTPEKNLKKEMYLISSMIGYAPNNETGAGDMVLNFYKPYMKTQFRTVNYNDLSDDPELTRLTMNLINSMENKHLSEKNTLELHYENDERIAEFRANHF